jgi:hypothetical protein
MKNEKWIIAQASVIGSLHKANSLPCQDAHLCKAIGQSEWLLCVVSDGAGSCEFSHVGSGKVVELVYWHFSELVKANKWIDNSSIPESEVWHRLAKNTFRKVFADLQEFAKTENYTLESLSATVILVIATPLGLLVSHIGDGRAGYQNLQGEWKSMMTPFKGEYANETIFITSPIWEDDKIDTYIESQVIAEPINAFVLMSDGCENACYETTIFIEENKQYENINKPFAGFFNPITQTLKGLVAQGKTAEEVNLLWEDYLTDGTEEFAKEQDDKTLILVVKNDYVNTL